MTVKSISLVEKHSQFEAPWSPKRIATVDNYDIKLAKAEGDFAWHKHDDEDEMFFISRGLLEIEIEGQDPVILGPGELCVIHAVATPALFLAAAKSFDISFSALSISSSYLSNTFSVCRVQRRRTRHPL